MAPLQVWVTICYLCLNLGDFIILAAIKYLLQSFWSVGLSGPTDSPCKAEYF